MSDKPFVMDYTHSGAELWKAFVAFTGDVGNIEKNKTNPHFKSIYLDLAGAMEGCRPHLAKHELAVMQHPTSTGDLIGVTTILIHSSGQRISSELTLRPVKGDPQSAGSAITYARRYAYMAILGIAPEDDDGNAASQKPNQNGNNNRNGHQRSNQGNQPAIQKNEKHQDQKAQDQEKPKSDEFFDMEIQEHRDRLEKILERKKIAPDVHMDVAAMMHGKTMIEANLDAVLEQILREPTP